MFEAKAIKVDDKVAFYDELAQQLEGLLSGERDAIANAAIPRRCCSRRCLT